MVHFLLPGLQVATKGWVGLGFSPNGGMRGADITLGWVDSHGELHVHVRCEFGDILFTFINLHENKLQEDEQRSVFDLTTLGLMFCLFHTHRIATPTARQRPCWIILRTWWWKAATRTAPTP